MYTQLLLHTICILPLISKICLLDDHLRAEVSYCSLGKVQFGTCCVHNLPSLKHPKTNMSRENRGSETNLSLWGKKDVFFLRSYAKLPGSMIVWFLILCPCFSVVPILNINVFFFSIRIFDRDRSKNSWFQRNASPPQVYSSNHLFSGAISLLCVKPWPQDSPKTYGGNRRQIPSDSWWSRRRPGVKRLATLEQWKNRLVVDGFQGIILLSSVGILISLY